MEKLYFNLDVEDEAVGFYVFEQTKVNGSAYLLVTETLDDDGECLILKDISLETDEESIYEVVEDDKELLAVSKVFEELLEDVDIEL